MYPDFYAHVFCEPLSTRERTFFLIVRQEFVIKCREKKNDQYLPKYMITHKLFVNGLTGTHQTRVQMFRILSPK